ncbi:hypothetical protein [Prosthecobacter sp.]|uniref:hypothetical protein n=1 Tax=Prosthecobacter sp. TaxID=1965333 RepID=UPI001E162033|nr:hypothetical protein [Prosthecobacter sp.]MCB1278858.1 hypothetical protein [Prosthecobacter sp.]
MSISLEPNKGLRLKLGRLSPIRTWHGGGNFWSHEFQLTVRSGALAGFLPRAIEDEDSVLFEYRSGGAEQASTSTAISSMSEIPAKELNALRAAIDELKRKADDPHCDRTKRQMIEGFRLPDPQKDRDLYRLIGKGSSAKLIVLWGIEREEGSALAPGAAVDLMHTPPGESESSAPTPKKSKLVPILLLLAALAGGGWYYHQEQEKKRIAEEAAAQEAALAAAKAEEARIAAFNAAAASKNATVSSPNSTQTPPVGPSTTPMTIAAADPATSTPASAQSTSSSDSKKSMISETKSDSSKSVDPKKSPDSKSTVSADSTKKSTDIPKAATTTTPAPTKSSTTSSSTAIKPITAAPGTIVRNSSGVITGVFGKDGKLALANPGTVVSKDGKVTAHAPGTVIRGSSGVCTGVCDKDGKVIPAKLGRIIEDTNGTLKSAPPGTLIRDSKGVITGVCDADGKIISASHGTVLDKEGKITTSAPGTVLRDSFGTVTGVAGADGKIVNAAPGSILEDDSIKNLASSTSDTPPGSVTTPMTTQGPPPVGISSLSVVSTSLSSVLGSGNVEVLLNVVARDNAGAVVNAPPITGWKVNGQLQSKPDGTPADGPVIPVSLPPGIHRISTVGRGFDGQPFQTDADVQVTPKS